MRFFSKKIRRKNRRKTEFRKTPPKHDSIDLKMAMQRKKPRVSAFETIETSAEGILRRPSTRKELKKASRETNSASLSRGKTIIVKPKPFSDPFKQGAERVKLLDQKSICKQRKLTRKYIMIKTNGQGMSIKSAEWTPESLVKCRS